MSNFLSAGFGDNTTPVGVVAKIHGDINRLMKDSADLAREAATAAAEVMSNEAPIGETGGLVSRITHDDHATWHPGGAGGGGFWEATAGVLDTGEDYPLFVAGGTGEHAGEGLDPGGIGLPAKGRITPAEGNVFPMMVMGGLIFRQWQRGQRAQTDWITGAQEAADELVRLRLSSLGDN